jgi:hypothetical protein
MGMAVEHKLKLLEPQAEIPINTLREKLLDTHLASTPSMNVLSPCLLASYPSMTVSCMKDRVWAAGDKTYMRKHI